MITSYAEAREALNNLAKAHECIEEFLDMDKCRDWQTPHDNLNEALKAIAQIGNYLHILCANLPMDDGEVEDRIHEFWADDHPSSG